MDGTDTQNQVATQIQIGEVDEMAEFEKIEAAMAAAEEQQEVQNDEVDEIAESENVEAAIDQTVAITEKEGDPEESKTEKPVLVKLGKNRRSTLEDSQKHRLLEQMRLLKETEDANEKTRDNEEKDDDEDGEGKKDDNDVDKELKPSLNVDVEAEKEGGAAKEVISPRSVFEKKLCKRERKIEELKALIASGKGYKSVKARIKLAMILSEDTMVMNKQALHYQSKGYRNRNHKKKVANKVAGRYNPEQH